MSEYVVKVIISPHRVMVTRALSLDNALALLAGVTPGVEAYVVDTELDLEVARA